MRDPEEGVDEHGFIVTGVRADRVPESFQPIVHAAMSATRAEEDATRPRVIRNASYRRGQPSPLTLSSPV